MIPGPLTTEEQETIYEPSQEWSNEFALKIVKADFTAAEQYRNTNHDWRWRTADELYLGWVPTKYWEGTKIPRSSLGIYLTFEQIESIMPKVVSAIFGDNPWFQVEPHPGTGADQARAVRDLMLQQLEEADFREELRRGVKSLLTYGNMILELGWYYAKVQRKRYVHQFTPVKQTMMHPLMGQPVDIPTGEMQRNTVQQDYTEEINRPFAKYVSVKDFYIDPNCQSPKIQDARFCVKRALLSVDEIKQFRGQDGFYIPDDKRLIEMSRTKPTAHGDWTKASAESYRSAQYFPSVDQTQDPGGKRVEVLAYTTKDRIVWVGNREEIFFNEVNPYGFINYFGCPYADVLDRFYALSITDVLEPEQRLQQSIINARIDELALSIHPPMVKRRGVSLPSYQLRNRPGQVWEVEDPTKDIQFMRPNNVTQDAFIEVQASELRAQKTTGVTDLAVLGTPSAGGNSANRTATGVSTQTQASASRIQYIVENVENFVVEPLLTSWHKLNTLFLDPEQVIPIVGPDEAPLINIDPQAVISANVGFSIRASAKMQSRQALQQLLPLMMQTLLNPQLLSMLAQQQQQTINIQEVFELIREALNYRSRKSLFRPLSQQELQQMNQPPPQEQMKMQMQQQRLAAQTQHVAMKGQFDLQKQGAASDAADSMAEDQHMVELVKSIVQSILDERLVKKERKKNAA